MSDREINRRLIVGTPCDYGGSGDDLDRPLRTGSREINRTSLGRRVTPQDFGGTTPQGLVTVRAFDADGGTQQWAGRRPPQRWTLDGVGQPFVEPYGCFAVLHHNGRVYTVGSACAGARDGVVIRWSSFGTVSKRSRSGTDGEFCAVFRRYNSTSHGYGRNLAVISNGLIWVAGWEDTGSGLRAVVQGFDQDTLNAEVVTVLPVTYTSATRLNQVLTSDEIVDIAASEDGAVVHRRGQLDFDNSGGAHFTVDGHAFERVDASGTIVASQEFATRLGVVGVEPLDQIVHMTLGRDGRVWAIDKQGTYHITSTDADFVAASSVNTGVADPRPLEPGTYYNASGSVNPVDWFAWNIFRSPLLASDSGGVHLPLRLAWATGARLSPGGGFLSVVDIPRGCYITSSGTLVGTSSGLTQITNASQHDNHGAILRPFGLGTGTTVINGTSTVVRGSVLYKMTGATCNWETSNYVVIDGDRYYYVPTTANRVYTAGSGHSYLAGRIYTPFGDYLSGTAAVTGDASKIDGSTGATLWVARHHSDGGTEALHDAIEADGAAYICGDASAYVGE